MNTREKSIQILKDAVANKTLGAYKGATGCRYYDKATDSCCAVGALILREELMKNVNEDGDVRTLIKDGQGDIKDILAEDNWQNNTGLTDDELIELQRKHDDIIYCGGCPLNFHTFESYVNSLV